MENPKIIRPKGLSKGEAVSKAKHVQSPKGVPTSEACLKIQSLKGVSTSKACLKVQSLNGVSKAKRVPSATSH